jgi:hypothetical protein
VQEEQKSYDIIYGTQCTTPAVQRLVTEKLGGVAGCLADWYQAYYGHPPGDYSVYNVFGQIPAFQVGPLEPVKEEEEEVETGEEHDWNAWEKFLESKRVVQITLSLQRIYERVQAKGAADVRKWIDQMKKMVYTDSFVEFGLTSWNDIDLLHVAVEGRKVRPAYPLVREAIAHFVEQVQGRAVFYNDQAVWAALSQELEGERVPAVAGLLTERCAIGAIIDGQGFKAVLKMEKTEQFKLVFFDRDAEASSVLTEQEDFRKSGLEMRISCFVPRSPFYPAMDMAVLVFKKRKEQQGDYRSRASSDASDLLSLTS